MNLKWNSRTNHMVRNRRFPMLTLLCPFTKAQLTIYWFYTGKRYAHKNYNCRCVSVPNLKSESV